MFQSQTGYMMYVVFLFISTGAFILGVDARRFKHAKMRREGKYAFFLGCFNIAAGLAAWGGNWAYMTFLA